MELHLKQKRRRLAATKAQLPTINEVQAKLSGYFADLPDPRVSRTQKHLLKDILVIAVLAAIAGARGWEDIENYGISKQQWARRIFRVTQWDSQ